VVKRFLEKLDEDVRVGTPAQRLDVNEDHRAAVFRAACGHAEQKRGLPDTAAPVDELVTARRETSSRMPGRGGTNRVAVSSVARSASASSGRRRITSSSLIAALPVVSSATSPDDMPDVMP